MDFSSMPAEGMSQAEIETELEQLRAADTNGRATFGERWLNDRGLLLDDGALEVAKKAHQTFFTKNNSSAVIMPLESELVSWVLDLFHSERGAAGILTTGGSESLFLATAAALARFQERRSGYSHNRRVGESVPGDSGGVSEVSRNESWRGTMRGRDPRNRLPDI